MRTRLMVFAISISFLIFSNLLFADVNVLIIGSMHSFLEGEEIGVEQQRTYNPSTITTRLQSILSQDSARSKGVFAV
jgi:hypothetical protein